MCVFIIYCRILPWGNSYCVQHRTTDQASHELFSFTRINGIICWGNNLKINGFSKCILFCNNSADWNRSLSDTMNNWKYRLQYVHNVSLDFPLNLECDWNSNGIWILKSRRYNTRIKLNDGNALSCETCILHI